MPPAMQALYSLSEAAEQLGIPRRSLYNYWQRGLIPCVDREGVARITAAQIKLIKAVLTAYGRRGIRDGVIFAASQPDPVQAIAA